MLPVLLFGRNFTENPIVLSGQPRHHLHFDGAVLFNKIFNSANEPNYPN